MYYNTLITFSFPCVGLPLLICDSETFYTPYWFEIVSKHVWFSTRFSFGFSAHPPNQNEAFWLGDNIMNISEWVCELLFEFFNKSVRSSAKRVLHFVLICFHISHSLAFAFVPKGFFDSHRSHVAKQRQLNRWYNLISIAFLQVPFRYGLPF